MKRDIEQTARASCLQLRNSSDRFRIEHAVTNDPQTSCALGHDDRQIGTCYRRGDFHVARGAREQPALRSQACEEQARKYACQNPRTTVPKTAAGFLRAHGTRDAGG